jgi:nitrogen fixation NifU-like protein
MPIYSEKVMEHFANPRNVGTISDPDGVGEVGNPVCGDMMTFYVKVKDGIVEDVKFQTFGCGAAIAVSSMVSEMAIGKTVAEAKEITNAAVAEELGGLPANKMHCSNLGADALRKALEDYEAKQGSAEPVAAVAAEPAHAAVGPCVCPYCSHEEPAPFPVCAGCGKEVAQCSAPAGTGEGS